MVRLHGFRWPASQVYKLMILVANIYRLAEMFSLSLSLSRSNLGIVWQECSLLPSRLTKDVIKERLQVEGQVKAAI